jgi:hypothetical protein
MKIKKRNLIKNIFKKVFLIRKIKKTFKIKTSNPRSGDECGRRWWGPCVFCVAENIGPSSPPLLI